MLILRTAPGRCSAAGVSTPRPEHDRVQVTAPFCGREATAERPPRIIDRRTRELAGIQGTPYLFIPNEDGVPRTTLELPEELPGTLFICLRIYCFSEQLNNVPGASKHYQKIPSCPAFASGGALTNRIYLYQQQNREVSLFSNS